MKKQTLLVLLMSALLVTGCAKPAAESNESEQPASNESQEVAPSSKVENESSEQELSSEEQSSSSTNQWGGFSWGGWGQSSTQASSVAPIETQTAPDNDIHTDLQYTYLQDPDWRNIKAYVPTVNAERSGSGIEQSKPKALKLAFNDVADASTYYVQVSKDNTFADAPVLTTTVKEYELWNAEIATKYYYRAAVSEDALASATVKEFQVADLAPRNLKVDGMINFRDIGGWKSSLVPNGVIKQGLYYRCAQFDNNGRATITATGKAEIKRLGIKLDIDMRDRPPSSSSASSTDWQVDILDAHIASGTEATRWEGFADVYKKIFEAIAVSDQKPIALHCTHGADRTGIASFFLLALLGVSKEDCGRDYCFTRFAGERKVLPADEFDNWVSKTEALNGATFADKMFNHLLSKGISADTLETIRELYVPGYHRAA